MNIKEDPHFQEFILNHNIREVTINDYEKRLNKYCEFTGLNPTELIEQAEEDEENRIRMKNRRIKKHLLKFVIFLKDQGNAPNYISGLISLVRSFYREFEIELPRIRCNIQEEQELITTDTIVNKSHIQKALKYCSPRNKAIVLLMMSSGMGSSEIRHLTFKDFINAFKIDITIPLDIDSILQELKNKQDKIGTWSIRRYKTGMPYVTFNSPESTNAIIDYLQFREENNYPIKDLDDWLFEAWGSQIAKETFITFFKRLNDRAGLGKQGRQRFFKAHALRKFFASTLKNNGMDSLTAEWLIGHKVKMVTDAYIKPDIYRLKKDYLDVLPHLSIEEIETKTIYSLEYQKLKEKYELDSKAKDEELAKMNRRIELMERLLNDKKYAKNLIEKD